MNVQNIPRNEKDVKRAFRPKNDAFLFFDYKAIEVRLLAYYLAIGIRDHSLVNEIAEGLDPHLQTAKGLYGREDISDEMRQLGVDYPEARRLLGAYHATRPGINILRSSLDSVLATRGYLINSHGRHLHVQDSHKALNALIQGSAADVMREAVVKSAAVLAPMQSHIVNIIHDEIMIDAAEREIPTIIEYIPQMMRPTRISKVIPIEVLTM